jgi:5'-nucleotidase
MRILISNDDSIYAEGIKVLYSIAKNITDDIWVVAPETEQSGAGHSLSLRKVIRIDEEGNNHFAVHGTPTDCVLVAIRELMLGKKPDLVLSGINHGSNLAEDITYSGTVAAAMEATLLGIPAIALSQKIDRINNIFDFSVSKKYALDVINKLYATKWFENNPNTLMNVNFPMCDVNEVKGVKFAKQGRRIKSENIQKCMDPENRPFFWIGSIKQFDIDSKESDLGIIQQNNISITPVSLELTDKNLMEKMNNLNIF